MTTIEMATNLRPSTSGMKEVDAVFLDSCSRTLLTSLCVPITQS